MKKIFLGVLALAIETSMLQAQQLQPFKDGERVVFTGNSITEAGFYESNIWLYYMTHFPDRKVTLFNSGIGGDVVGQMNERFEHDVLAKDPTVVVLTFGMNDSGYFEFNAADAEETAKQRVEKSYNNFMLLQDKLKARPQIQKVLMSSSPYDETVKNDRNYFRGKFATMEKIVAFQKKAAEKDKWGYVDLFYPMTEINLRGQKEKPEFTISGPDRIHPGKGGHLIMAAMFLKNQGLAGKPVARISIDARKGVLASENAGVEVKKKSPTSVEFDYKANSLPFPIDSISALWDNPQKQSDVLAIYPFIEEFNQETLQVKNLKKGNYNLLIDGKRIGTFSADTLSKGINMALMSNTPQYQQAKEIMHLNDLRNDLERKLRDYYWLHFNYFKGENLLFNDSWLAFDKVREKAKTDGFVRSKMDTYQTARLPEVRAMWENNIKLLTQKIYQINQPKTRKIEVVSTQQ